MAAARPTAGPRIRIAAMRRSPVLGPADTLRLARGYGEGASCRRPEWDNNADPRHRPGRRAHDLRDPAEGAGRTGRVALEVGLVADPPREDPARGGDLAAVAQRCCARGIEAGRPLHRTARRVGGSVLLDGTGADGGLPARGPVRAGPMRCAGADGARPANGPGARWTLLRLHGLIARACVSGMHSHACAAATGRMLATIRVRQDRCGASARPRRGPARRSPRSGFPIPPVWRPRRSPTTQRCPAKPPLRAGGTPTPGGWRRPPRRPERSATAVPRSPVARTGQQPGPARAGAVLPCHDPQCGGAGPTAPVATSCGSCRRRSGTDRPCHINGPRC